VVVGGADSFGNVVGSLRHMSDEPTASGSRLPSRVVAMGASAGGISPIAAVVSALPADVDAAVLVVLHMSATAHSALPLILARHTQLTVAPAVDGDVLIAGRVYVAVPDHHLTVERGRVRVTRGPTHAGYRPAIDTLFRSVARWWTDRAIGVVLSGALDDGSAGLVAIRSEGGVAFVQAPEEAEVRDMPLAALHTGATEDPLPALEIGERITQLAGTVPRSPHEPDSPTASHSPDLVAEDEGGSDPAGTSTRPLPKGSHPSGFVCPDCGGALFELPNPPLRFRCRVGHGWTTGALQAAHQDAMEEALWTALRILEEDLALQERIAERARAENREAALVRIRRRLAERSRLLETLRNVVGRLADAPQFGGIERAIAESDVS
jgi:two-component system chemotaxis response regulator CheB